MNLDETANYLQFYGKHLIYKELDEKINQLPEKEKMDIEYKQTPTKLTPSKIGLRRNNSAFKAHISTKSANQCKPLSISKNSTYNGTFFKIKSFLTFKQFLTFQKKINTLQFSMEHKNFMSS